MLGSNVVKSRSSLGVHHGGAGGWVGGMAVICGGEPQPFAMTNECFGYSVQVYVDDYLWRGT